MHRKKPGFDCGHSLQRLKKRRRKSNAATECAGVGHWNPNPVPRVPYYLRHRKPPQVFPVTEVFPLRAGCGAGFQVQGLTNPAPAETIDKLHPSSVWACGAVWERASMAWKRSSVRSRPGPPNHYSRKSRNVHNSCIIRYLVRSLVQYGTRMSLDIRGQSGTTLGASGLSSNGVAPHNDPDRYQDP